MRHRVFDKLLATHCAPALAGIKPSNMMSCPIKDLEGLDALLHRYNNCMNPKGISLYVLHKDNSKALVFVYRPSLLTRSLNDAKAQKLLLSFGYSESDSLDQMLLRLSGRVGSKGEFPHEIGLFLGYPPEDVSGFISNRGKDYKLCGYWKVYSNVSNAKALFDKYTRCRHWFCRRVDESSILELLKAS